MAEDEDDMPAIFEAQDRIYEVDNCDPVKEAVAQGLMRNVALVHGSIREHYFRLSACPKLLRRLLGYPEAPVVGPERASQRRA